MTEYPRPPRDAEEREACGPNDQTCFADGDGDGRGWVCSRRRGHTGDHVCSLDRQILARWPSTPAVEAKGPRIRACDCGHAHDIDEYDVARTLCRDPACKCDGWRKPDLFRSLSQEAYDSLEGPSREAMECAMERGRREAYAMRTGLKPYPLRRLPEDAAPSTPAVEAAQHMVCPNCGKLQSYRERDGHPWCGEQECLGFRDSPSPSDDDAGEWWERLRDTARSTDFSWEELDDEGRAAFRSWLRDARAAGSKQP